MKRKLTATTVAGRIRERRLALKLTQIEASARAGWKGNGTWANIEGARRRLLDETLEKIAAALSVPGDECRAKDLMP